MSEDHIQPVTIVEMEPDIPANMNLANMEAFMKLLANQKEDQEPEEEDQEPEEEDQESEEEDQEQVRRAHTCQTNKQDISHCTPSH